MSAAAGVCALHRGLRPTISGARRDVRRALRGGRRHRSAGAHARASILRQSSASRSSSRTASARAPPIGATYVAKSPPDGYTHPDGRRARRWRSTSSVFKKLAYHAAGGPDAGGADRQFAVRAGGEQRRCRSRSVAGPGASSRSRKPGELTYASSGPGSAHHLDMQLLASMTGIKLTHVALQGNAPGAERRGRRPRPDDVLRYVGGAAADRVRERFARWASRPPSASQARRNCRPSPRAACRATTPRRGRWWSHPPNMPSRWSISCYRAALAIQEKPEFRTLLCRAGHGAVAQPAAG